MKCLIYIFLFSTFSVSAQSKGVVVDENNNPIPYVNIWIENENIGTTSEQDGSFSLQLKSQEKNLIFSAIGFENKIIKANETEKVVLKNSLIQLDEVVIKKRMLELNKEIGNYENGGFRDHENYFVNGIYFKILEEDLVKYPFIKEVKFRSLSENKNAKIRVYLVERKEDGSPGLQLLSDEIIIEVKKGNTKSKINFSSKKIEIPKEGFFVVFEKLKIEQNKHYFEYNYKDKDGKKVPYKGLSYEPEIPLVPLEEDIGWNKRTNDKWEKSSKTTIQNPNSFENILMKKYHNKYLIPSVSVTITN